MGRSRRIARNLGLALVALLAVCLLVALLGDEDPIPESELGAEVAPVVESNVEVRARAPARVPNARPAIAEDDWGRMWRLAPAYARARIGGTDFARRLAFGELLLRLRADLLASRIRTEEAQAGVEINDHYLLSVEGPDRRLGDLGEPTPAIPRAELLLWLSETTNPARHRAAFDVHGTRPQMPEDGATCLVRIWTPKGTAFPVARIKEAESLLRRFDGTAGTRSEHGYDVLATPARGDDVFPHLELPGYVIGVYYLRDELAIIGTDHGARDMQLLLNHELIHAWQCEALPKWNRRFVMEGLAEYAAWILPGDTSLDVPDRRLQDNLAAMVRIVDALEARGANMKGFPLAKLVRASPWGFYGLGWFAYVVAQACYAYLPSGTLERPLRSGDEAVLSTAFEAIRWSDFLAWARGVAEGGDASRMSLIGDVPAMELQILSISKWGPPGRLIRELFGDGLRPDEYSDLIRGGEVDPGLATPERVRAALDALSKAGADGVDLVCETTDILEAPLDEARAASAPWYADQLPPAGERGLSFVVKLRRWLAARGGVEPRLAASAATTRIVDRVLVEPGAAIDLRKLMDYLRECKARTKGHLVLCLGSRGDAWRPLVEKEIEDFDRLPAAEQRAAIHASAVRRYTAGLASMDWSARTVLVIDLGDGSGEARDLAAALSRVAPKGAIVAYWALQPPLDPPR